jgi:predicted RND superfamily exporter protein
MWSKLADFILRYRWQSLLAIAITTVFFGYYAGKVQLTYDFAKIIPADDPDYIDYIKFKNTFGEDGNVLVIGVQSDKIFEYNFFNDWSNLTKQIEGIDGIEKVVSLSNIQTINRNDSLQTLSLQPLLKSKIENQSQLDSFKNQVADLKFYNGFLYNPESNVTLLAITLKKEKLDSKERIPLVNSIEQAANEFGKKYGCEMHYSGLPYVRTVMSSKVADEIKIFIYLSILVTAIFIFVFFRFISAVILSLVVVIVGVICTVGTIALFGYKISLLTGIIPPLMVIVGVQNCIYLLNVYHQEFLKHNDKIKAIKELIAKNGLALFLTNITTAIGFCVFSFSGSAVLDQFSVVSGINIMLIYVISLVFIPIVYSYLPPPKVKHTKHLEAKRLNKVLAFCNYLVYNKRKAIYISTILLVLASVGGALMVDGTGYVVDDMPEENKVYKDLKFFEKNLKGILPYEIAIDTKRPNGIKDYATLQKINRLEKELAKIPEFSKATSVVDFLKFANQGMNNGDVRYYQLPDVLAISEIVNYLPKQQAGKPNLLKSMVDSTFQTARVSIQMADVGSTDIKRIHQMVQQKVDSIFDKNKYSVKLTGTSAIFLKGNDYLINNLLSSVFWALLLNSFMMIFLFASWRMMLISLLPNIIPLIVTLGIMGFFHIRLKPSTIIIFSIAYGIVVDFTIHYLAKYRHSLKKNNWDMSIAIPESLTEAGPSIIYTAVALFGGFIIFAASSFGGTIALGVLTSLSLIFGMLMNLLLLPSLLLSLEKSINNKKEFDTTFVEVEPED